MDAGELRERITIQSPVAATDTQGGRGVRAWTDFLTNVPAKIVAGGVGEREGERDEAGAIGAHTIWTVTVRYRPTITVEMLVLWRPYRATVVKQLEVHMVAVRPGRPMFLDLSCGELV